MASRMRLGNTTDLRREMGKLYREMRGGTLETSKGCKLAYVLQQLSKLVVGETIEQRAEQSARDVGKYLSEIAE